MGQADHFTAETKEVDNFITHSPLRQVVEDRCNHLHPRGGDLAALVTAASRAIRNHGVAFFFLFSLSHFLKERDAQP